MLTLTSTQKRLALLIVAAFSLPAAAEPDEGAKLLAGLGYYHDDNLFRLSSNRLGDAARSAMLGLSFDKRYSLQEIQAQATLSKFKFQRYRQLDYDGKDGRIDWHWQLGSHWNGQLGASYVQLLAPYTDFLSTQRNLRVQRRRYLDGGWRLHPGWRLHGGAARDVYDYDLALQRVNNRREDTLDAGLDFLPASGSTVGLVARRIKGRYQNRRLSGGALLDDSFEQDEFKARVLWLASGSTTVQALAGHARRRYPGADGRSSSGFNGRLSVSHAPAGKLRVGASAWREFSAVESHVVSSSLNQGASMTASYLASEKLRADASLSVERRRYQASISLNGPQDLDDTLRNAQLSLRWTPRRSVTVTAAVGRQARSGSPFLGLGSFRANSASLNAELRF